VRAQPRESGRHPQSMEARRGDPAAVAPPGLQGTSVGTGVPGVPLTLHPWLPSVAAPRLQCLVRYDPAVISALKREVLKMEESITYQEIKGLGRLEEARKMILRQGKRRFGRASRKAAQALEAITDLERLEVLGERLVEAKSWEELLTER